MLKITMNISENFLVHIALNFNELLINSALLGLLQKHIYQDCMCKAPLACVRGREAGVPCCMCICSHYPFLSCVSLYLPVLFGKQAYPKYFFFEQLFPPEIWGISIKMGGNLVL